MWAREDARHYCFHRDSVRAHWRRVRGSWPPPRPCYVSSRSLHQFPVAAERGVRGILTMRRARRVIMLRAWIWHISRNRCRGLLFVTANRQTHRLYGSNGRSCRRPPVRGLSVKARQRTFLMSRHMIRLVAFDLVLRPTTPAKYGPCSRNPAYAPRSRCR